MQNKRAFGGLTAAGGTAIELLSNLGTTGAVAILAASVATGAGAGYLAAKLTAKGKQDIDTAKKQYENERLRSDIGYLQSRVKSEYEAFKDQYEPKPARIIA